MQMLGLAFFAEHTFSKGLLPDFVSDFYRPAEPRFAILELRGRRPRMCVSRRARRGSMPEPRIPLGRP